MTEREFDEYVHLTGPGRLSRALHTLEGLLLGIAIDRRINDEELKSLTAWVRANEEFSDRTPFTELIPLLSHVLADRQITEEERADVLWCCGRFTSEDGFYAETTANMQRLQGILAGVIADGKVTSEEARNLAAWMSDYEELKTVWPYTEIDAVLTHVLADGVVDEEEQQLLLNTFSQFSGTQTRPTHPKDDKDERLTIQGICACAPEIAFDGRLFCFTGESERWTRKSFAELIERRGAKFHPRVTRSLNYLVVGGGGNPCWAYSCYGRKVEEAMKLRKEGHSLLIVHEYDMWDAIEDLPIQPH